MNKNPKPQRIPVRDHVPPSGVNAPTPPPRKKQPTTVKTPPKPSPTNKSTK